jgi:RNA polymerase sigma-70 factor (ECF subfamily)
MDDTLIIKLFFERSENAIQELSQKYGRLCNHIAFNILKNQQDADECENDTYLHTWNSIPPQEPNVLKAYVCRICRNLALNRWKYYTRKRRNKEMNLLLSEVDECIPSSMNVEASADDTVIRVLNDFLENLDSQSRILFIQRYFYLESTQALGERFGMSASGVSTKLNRVRKRLKQNLEQEGIVL